MTPLQPLKSIDFAKLFSSPPPVIVPPSLPTTHAPSDGKSSNTAMYIVFTLLACGMFVGFYYLYTLIEERNKEMFIALNDLKIVPAISAKPKPIDDSEPLKTKENEKQEQSVV